VDVGHQLIGRHGDVCAALDDHTIIAHAPIPQARKAKQLLIGESDQIRRLATSSVEVPLVKA
jgi:hypothetical protein